MKTLGAELSVELFAPANWRPHTVTPPTADYPGMRPTGSWMLRPDGVLRGIDPCPEGWCDRQSGAAIDLSDRHLVLAYGSNPDPNKLLNRNGFLGGEPVIALRAAVFGWAAAWCDSRRGDGAVVATLVPAPTRVEVHPVLALTAHQIDKMNRWEGDPTYYRKAPHSGLVVLESGELAPCVDVFLGTPEYRWARRGDDGAHLLCAEVSYAEIDEMVAL